MYTQNTLNDFGNMINDTRRMNAYYEALRRVIRPDSVVVDLGAGTGIFSLMACQLGARRVYAIDPNPWIELGEKMAAANGFADRFVKIKDLSTAVTLPEPVDIIVSEIRGSHALVSGNITSVSDARRRFLKPTGVLIPQRDIVYVSLISQPELYENFAVKPWQQNAYHLDLSDALPYALNTPLVIRYNKLSKPLFAPQVWTDVDYTQRDDPNASATLKWIASEACTTDYILVWFETTLFEDVGYTTAPWEEHPTIYRYQMFPFQAPLDLLPDDQIVLELNANLVQGDYIFTWNTSVYDRSGSLKTAYRQSSFYSSVVTDIHSKLFTKP